jgi:heme A synthase
MIENMRKHLLIRIVVPIVLFLLLYLVTENQKNDAYGGKAYLALLFFGLCFLIYFIIIIVETVYLQIQKKFKLRNANLIFIGLVVLLLIISKLTQ